LFIINDNVRSEKVGGGGAPRLRPSPGKVAAGESASHFGGRI